MSMIHSFKRWAKNSAHPVAVTVRTLHRHRHSLELPPFLCRAYRPLLALHRTLRDIIAGMMRIFYWTPLFKSQLAGPAPRLFLYGGLPYLSGPLTITCGEGCRISGATTFSGRTAAAERPRLIIGDRVGIGWQTTIAVGSQVILHDDVRIAGRSFFAGYPGHPLDASARAAGAPDSDDQVGDIILHKDVWLGTGVMVMAGVTIGEGTIVAAGSIVTKSLPAHVLAGGNPARVLKPLSALSDSARQEAAQ